MTEDPNTAPLSEWNRLEKKNAEDAIIASMYEAGAVATEASEAFSTWLLLGTLGIGGFMISNIEKLVPFLSHAGFIACGAALVLSCTCGLFSKYYVVQVRTKKEMFEKTREIFARHVADHSVEQDEIEKIARSARITLETALDMNRMRTEIVRRLPWFARWSVDRIYRK